MIDEKLLKQIDDYIEENREAILADIGALVAVDSVQSAPEAGAPFGAGARRALDQALKIASRLGLDVKNCDGHIGWGELPGRETEKYLATITHLDVVPAGNGWDADPFTMRVRDGWLLGRGVADDKGPTVVCLHALAFLKKAGIPLRYPVRALLGVNEETGMEDVAYYLANYPAPAFLFTPDAEFPVCNGEKGQFGGTIRSKPLSADGAIVEMEGGVANNAVPDRAYALIRADLAALPEAEHITLEAAGEGLVRVRGWGVSGHAAMPAGTRNAIGVVVDYLLANGIGSADERGYLTALHRLHQSTAGEGLGIACEDEPFGPLTIIGGRIFVQDGCLVQTFDSRYPTTADGDAMAEKLAALLAEDPAIAGAAVLGPHGNNKPFYISADSPAIRACIDTFNEITGQQASPFTMGGGTYARHFPYAVSFGPEHAETVQPPFGGPMHGANESANVAELLEAMKIYTVALLRLEDIDF